MKELEIGEITRTRCKCFSFTWKIFAVRRYTQKRRNRKERLEKRNRKNTIRARKQMSKHNTLLGEAQTKILSNNLKAYYVYAYEIMAYLFT